MTDREKLAALHDDLCLQYSQTDDEQEESRLLEEIGIIEFILFYGQ